MKGKKIRAEEDRKGEEGSKTEQRGGRTNCHRKLRLPPPPEVRGCLESEPGEGRERPIERGEEKRGKSEPYIHSLMEEKRGRVEMTFQLGVLLAFGSLKATAAVMMKHVAPVSSVAATHHSTSIAPLSRAIDNYGKEVYQ